MKKSHISIITIISIIFLLVLLFFTAPVESQDVGIESLGKTSKAFASVTSSTISTVVFIYVNEVKNTNNFLRTLQNSIKDKTLVLLRKNEKMKKGNIILCSVGHRGTLNSLCMYRNKL